MDSSSQELGSFQGRGSGEWEEYQISTSHVCQYIRLVIESNHGEFYTGINRIQVSVLEGAGNLEDSSSGIAKMLAEKQRRAEEKEAAAQAVSFQEWCEVPRLNLLGYSGSSGGERSHRGTEEAAAGSV